MRGLPASAYLADFSRAGEGAAPNARPVVQPVTSIADRIEAARADGYERGKAEATAAGEGRLAELRARVDAELAEARKAWTAEQGARLAGQLQAGLDGLSAGLADATARVLEPFLTAQIKQRAIAELADTVKAILAREPEIGIGIAGPADLLAALGTRLSDAASSITYRASNQCEVEVRAGHTVLLTRLQDWARRIEEARA